MIIVLISSRNMMRHNFHMNQKGDEMYVVEIVSWKAASDVADQQMIDAVRAMVPDLEMLPGFRYQSLSKDDEGLWMDIYYWDSKEDAHNSNDLMANKPSLHNLIALIDMSSLKIEVLTPYQESGSVNFT